MGSHLVGPWHLVGATMDNTLDWKRIVRAIGWELNPGNNKPVMKQKKIIPRVVHEVKDRSKVVVQIAATM